jgi:hypothetical protein
MKKLIIILIMMCAGYLMAQPIPAPTLVADANSTYFTLTNRRIDPNFTSWEAWLETFLGVTFQAYDPNLTAVAALDTTAYGLDQLENADANEARANLRLGYFDIMMYPYLAAGNDDTNDTDAIQAAFDDCTSAGGGTVFIPEGVYKTTSTLYVSSNTYIWGAAGRYSEIKAYHNGAATLSLKGKNRCYLNNFALGSDTTTYPKTLLCLGRSSAGSAGWHNINNMWINGYASESAVYTIASEENLWLNDWMQLTGGTAKYAFYTSQGDSLSVDSMTGSTNNKNTLIGCQIFNNVDNDNCAAVYMQVAGATRMWTYRDCYFSVADDSYFIIDVGTVAASDCPGPINVENCAGEKSGGGSVDYGMYVFAAGSSPDRTLQGLRILGDWITPVNTANIYGDGNLILDGAVIESTRAMIITLDNDLSNSRLLVPNSTLTVSGTIDANSTILDSTGYRIGNSNIFVKGSNGYIGIGTSNPTVEFQGVVNAGRFLFSDSQTDNAAKLGRWGIPHYDVDEEPFYGIIHSTSNGINALDLGGGTSLGNASTVINFYTAANSSTTTGTKRGFFDNTGLTVVGDVNIPTGSTYQKNGVDLYDTASNGYPDGNDTAYDATSWDSNPDAPSMNAVRDKIEGLAGGHDAVTLTAGAEKLLALSSQEIDVNDNEGTTKYWRGDGSWATVAAVDPNSHDAATIDTNFGHFFTLTGQEFGVTAPMDYNSVDKLFYLDDGIQVTSDYDNVFTGISDESGEDSGKVSLLLTTYDSNSLYLGIKDNTVGYIQAPEGGYIQAEASGGAALIDFYALHFHTTADGNSVEWNTAYEWGDHSGTYLDLATYDVLEDGFADANDEKYSSAMNGSVNAWSGNSLYDYLHTLDTDDDNDIDTIDATLWATKQDVSATLTDLAALNETNGGIPYGSGDNDYSWLAAGAEGTLLMGNGAGAPSWLAAGTATYWLVAAGAADPVWTDPATLTVGTASACSGNSATATTATSLTTGKYRFIVAEPNDFYTNTDHEICIDPNVEFGKTITKVEITCDADPDTELDIDLYQADAFIGFGSASLIGAIDTTNGTSNITSFTDATVDAGKCLYLVFGAKPDGDTTQFTIVIYWSKT